MVQRRDWTRLPQELLEIIAGHLSDISDFLRFHCVCTSWNIINSSTSSPLPWLLLPSDDDQGNSSERKHPNKKRVIFSLSENRTYTISIPISSNDTRNIIYASSNGCLISLRTRPKGLRIPTFLNPLTRNSKTLLPPLQLAHKWPAVSVKNIKLFAPNLAVAVCDNGIFFCLLGEEDPSWKFIRGATLGDFAYRNGRLFVVHRPSATTWVLDLVNLELVSKIPMVGPRYYKRYLVECSTRGLLLVIRCPKRGGGTGFRLFRLEESRQNMEWAEVRSVKDCVLFVDHRNAMCFDAKNSERCRGNLVYYVGEDGAGDYRLMAYDLIEGKSSPIRPFLPEKTKHLLLWSKWMNPQLVGFR